MAKKKQEEAPAGAPAWMATFSDLMNLLLCFFVLLFSMSTIEEEKLQAAISSITSAFSIMDAPVGNLLSEGNLVSMGITQLPDFANYFGDTMSQGSEKAGDNSEAHENKTNEGINDSTGGQEGRDQNSGKDDESTPGGSQGDQDQQNPADQDADKDKKDNDDQENPGAQDEKSEEEEAQDLLAEKALEESEKMAEAMLEKAKEYGIQDLLDIDFNGQYVRYTLNGALLFESGKSEVRSEAKPMMKKLARILSAYSAYLIEIEGHTDNVPIHSSKYESNMVLSMYRALSVSDFILDNSKLDPANVYASGRGEYSPIATNDTPEGRARNRRVEIKIYNSYSSDKLQD